MCVITRVTCNDSGHLSWFESLVDSSQHEVESESFHRWLESSQVKTCDSSPSQWLDLLQHWMNANPKLYSTLNPNPHYFCGKYCRGYHNWTNCCRVIFDYSLVDHVIGGILIEGIVKAEELVLQELGKVHLQLGLVHQHLVLAGHCQHIYVPLTYFCRGEIASRDQKCTVFNYLNIVFTSIPQHIDQFGFKNIISLHPPYLGGFQEHDKRWVFQTMYCFSSGTGVCLGHCIIFCLSWKPPRYGGRHALETELVYTPFKTSNATRLWSIISLLSWICIHQIRYPWKACLFALRLMPYLFGLFHRGVCRMSKLGAMAKRKSCKIDRFLWEMSAMSCFVLSFCERMHS